MPSAVMIARGLFGRGASGIGPPVEDRQPEAVGFCRRLRLRDGMDRGAAAKIGDMDRQILSDWIHRFNTSGPGQGRMAHDEQA
jgi:hypothetical protein